MLKINFWKSKTFRSSSRGGLICSSGSPDSEQVLPAERSAGACSPRCQVSEAGFARLTGFAGLEILLMQNSFHRSVRAWSVVRARQIPNKRRRLNVARGPVPRDLSLKTKNVRSREAPDVFCPDRCMARDRPSPYGERGYFPYNGERGRPVGAL